MDYIDREAALKAIKKAFVWAKRQDDQYDESVRQIERIPAADVQPVVRCRDCRWYEINELKQDGTEDRRYKPSVCMLYSQQRGARQYCSEGVRKDGDCNG